MERGLGYITGANQRKGVARMYPTRGVLPGLLRARRERPRGRRAEQRDEVASLHLRGHSMTSSARASSRPPAAAELAFRDDNPRPLPYGQLMSRPRIGATVMTPGRAPT